MAVKHLEQSATSVLYTDRRDFYIQPQVVKELWTDATPFLSIASQMSMDTVPDPDYKMFEHRAGWLNQSFAINAAAPAAWANNGDPDNTLAADAAVEIDGLVGLGTAGDHLENMVVEIWDETETTYKGVARITDYATNAVKLRSIGNPRVSNNRAAALADNDVCKILHNQFSEGSESPEAFADELEVVWNSAGITRTPLEITGTLYHETSLRGYSNELARIRQMKMFEHKMQLERMLLRGVRMGGTGSKSLLTDAALSGDGLNLHQSGANGTPIRATMGLISAIYRYGATTGVNKNIFSIPKATYDYDQWVDDSEQLFRFTPMGGRKIGLCGSKVISFWNKVTTTGGFVKNSGFSGMLDPTIRRDGLGFNFKYLETPHGTLELVKAPGLDGPYANMMIILSPENVGVKVFRPTKYSTNIKTENAYDGIKDEYFSDLGLWMNLIETHAAMVLA